MKNTVKIIKFNGKETEVKKIGLMEMGKITVALNRMPSVFRELLETGELALDPEKQSFVDVVEFILGILPAVFESSPEVLSVASGIEMEELVSAGFDDISEVIVAILELNNVPLIVKNFYRSRALLKM